MIKLRRGADVDTANPVHFHGTYVPGVGRQVWAQNWRGDWVCQVMHHISAPYGAEDEERAAWVDKIVKRVREDLTK